MFGVMSQSSQPRLETALRTVLAPILREDGFSGSGSTFRRVAAGRVQIINVQGARHGGSFAINLAIHPLAVPDLRDETPDPKKITQELCEFRRRLSETGADQWWKYEPTETGMASAMEDAAAVYKNVGRKIFDSVSGPSSPIMTVSAAEFAAGSFDFRGFGSTKVRMALTLARLRRGDGDIGESMAFAGCGLENVGNAVPLRRELQQLAGGQ
jgi:hypothetical protein